MYSEFMGITPQVARLIEFHRVQPDESKSDILARVLRVPVPTATVASPPKLFELGQGAKVILGEPVFLFLTQEAKREKRPDAKGEFREDGFYLDGERVRASKGSAIQPAMQAVQRRVGHLTSLSAWRQWHVLRDGKLIRLLDLKDPAKAKTRGRLTTTLTAEELGL